MKLLLNVTVFVLSGLGLLSQFGNRDFQVMSLFSIAGFGLLFIVAFNVLQFMINRNISSDHYLRAMSRIRKCFIEHDNNLSQYLTWQGNDGPTAFLDFSNLGLINQSLIFLAIFFSSFLCSLSSLYFQVLYKLVIVFIISLLVTYSSFHFITRRRLKIANDIAKNEVRFDLLYKDV